MPQLSIIIPVYNKADYIDNCIKSILGQTFADFELILVNDGSTDGSGKKCDYHATTDERIIVIHQENKGVSAARNAGLQIAKGSYIGFVDSDDELEDDMYELLVHTITSHNADMTMCGVRKVYTDKDRLFHGTNETTVFTREEAISALLKDEILGSVYDKIYKASLISNLRFEGRMYEDFYFNYLFLKKSKKIVFADVIKYHWMIRDNSVSMAKYNRKFMETVDVSDKILSDAGKEEMAHVDEARAFDFHMNLWVMNLLLFSSDRDDEAYEKLSARLKQYRSFAKTSPLVKKKYRYAFMLFSLSPVLYKTVMRVYEKVSNSEATKRK